MNLADGSTLKNLLMISFVDLSENAFLETVGDKEPGWNDELAGPEQKGYPLLEKMSVIPPLFELSYMVIFAILCGSYFAGR